MRHAACALLTAALLAPAARADEPSPRPVLDFLRSWASPGDALREAQARRQVQENLRTLGLMLKREDDRRAASGEPPRPDGPTANTLWLQHLLPHLEQGNLYAGPNFGVHPDARLGAAVEPIGAALASQLKLAKDRGQVLGEVQPGSAAAKAGLQTHDILLELDGKPVPADAAAFAKLLGEVKADAAVNAVVLRAGQRTEVKGLKLPADPVLKIYRAPSDPGPFGAIQDGRSNTLLWQGGWHNAGQFADRVPTAPKGYTVHSEGAVLTTTHRQDDRFTGRLQEGSLVITVTGTVKEGKAVVASVKVNDGGKEERFAALDRVPPEYRDKAAGLAAAAAVK